jgi:hypothetical protein
MKKVIKKTFIPVSLTCLSKKWFSMDHLKSLNLAQIKGMIVQALRPPARVPADLESDDVLIKLFEHWADMGNMI